MSLVQSTKSADTNDGAANTVATAAFGSNPTAGNAIVGHVSWQGSLGHLTNVTDNASGGTNTYSVIESWTVSTVDSIMMATICAQNIKTGASPLTVTANFSSTDSYRRIEVSEFNGVATTGQPNAHAHSADNATFSTSTDAITSGNGTTNVNGCTIFGVGYNEHSATIPTVGTGYTTADNMALGAGDAWRTESKVQASQGAVAATFTSAAGADPHGVGMIALAPVTVSGGFLNRNYWWGNQ